MAHRPMAEVLHQIRQTVLDDAGLTDGQLLEKYLDRRDRSALEALVRRHGQMVWSVCCRILSHHDAEDAFQATFLVLVRKAASILPRSMVANWLYGVAHQTALKARATLAKRKGREKHVATLPEPATVQRGSGDLFVVLDQELSRLPDRYRAVIVLCDLQGKTRQEAARHLGCPEGTVAGRLARARTMLAKRLARCGFALSGGAFATLSQTTASAVPTAVVAATVASAAGEAVSAKVAALTEGVLKMLLLKKLKVVGLVLLAVGVLAFSAGSFLVPSGLGSVAGGEKDAPRADSLQAASVQVLITGPQGMKVHVLTAANKDKTVTTPARLDLDQGKRYRLKLSDIPNRPGVERFPTLEIPKTTSAAEPFLTTSAIPVAFVDRDFEVVKDGLPITKVVYLETQDGDAATLYSPDSPGVDLVDEAKKRGTVLAVLRMGNIDLAGKFEKVGAPVEIRIGDDGIQGRVEKAKQDGVNLARRKVEELQKERIAALKEMAAVTTHLFQRGQVSFDATLEAQELVFEAELEAAEKESERNTFYKNLAEVLKKMEEAAKARVETARATHAPLLKIRARRLKVEIDWERAKARAAK